jgi:hypothetical protein
MAFGGVLLLIRDKVTHANFDRIAEGISLDEVRALWEEGQSTCGKTKALSRRTGLLQTRTRRHDGGEGFETTRSINGKEPN